MDAARLFRVEYQGPGYGAWTWRLGHRTQGFGIGASAWVGNAGAGKRD